MIESERGKQKAIIIASIKEIIEAHPIHTQQEIMDTLTEKGIVVNQSLVSRILREMGIIKSPNAEGGISYHLPWELSAPVPEDAMKSLVIRIEYNQSLIVVSTSPGAASLLARIIDFDREQLGILGTIAGDDIVFVAPKSIYAVEEVYENIKGKLWA